jgi:hypothetical protein
LQRALRGKKLRRVESRAADPRLAPLVRAAAFLLALAALAVTALFVHCVARRLPYPHELSKMEGGFVDHARWAAAGRPLYAAPSAEFVPFLYMPLAHHVGGALVRLGLDGFLATRLVSLAGIAGAVAAGLALVARATGRRALALLVPALACARYFDVECFYDQARPDDLMAAFCMLAVLALGLRSARAAVPLFVASGLLAFFTKQSAALFLAVLLGCAAWARWRVAVVSGAALAAAVPAIFLWLDARLDGWLRTYTLKIAAYHTVDRKGFLALVQSEFLNRYALAVAAAAVGAAAVIRARLARGASPGPAEDAAALARHMALSAVLAAGAFSLASSTQRLAVRNVYVLLALAAATYLPVALDSFRRWLDSAAAPRARAAGLSAALLVLALDVTRGARDPRPWTPTAQDVATWRRLLEACTRFGPPERTWVMLHGAAWGGREGDPFHLHFGALSDLMGGYFGRPTGIEVPADLRERIERRFYASIVVAAWDERARALLEGRYERAPDLEPIRLPMFSGYPPGLSEIWLPARSR